MGAALSSLQGKTWTQIMMQPIVLTTVAVLVASAAIVFLGLITKKRFKGSYSVAATDQKQASNECTLKHLYFIF